MAAFKDPLIALLGLNAQPRFLGLAPLDPARLPVDLVDMNDRKAVRSPKACASVLFPDPGWPTIMMRFTAREAPAARSSSFGKMARIRSPTPGK